jgi:hypothetical protein
MVTRTLRRRAAILALVGLSGCVVPVEPRVAKLGAYHLDLKFEMETVTVDGSRRVEPTKGRIKGILVIRERSGATATGSNMLIEAEFAIVSCDGLQNQFCRTKTFKTDPQWGGVIDSPTGDPATAQLLLEGSSFDMWLELDGEFEDGVYSGDALLRIQGFCCSNPTQTYTIGKFTAVK